MYVFSDINRGTPVSPNSCFTEVIDFVDFFGPIASLLLWGYSALLFITLISTCVLWGHKYKENNPKFSNNY